MNETDPGEQDVSDMQRLVNGHDAALNALMDRHGEKLFHYLIRHLQNETDAADLAQEAFVRVYQHRARFDPRQKFSSWLYTIATNLARDRLKWRSRHPEISLHQTTAENESSLADVLPDPKPLPNDVLTSSERGNAVRAAVAALPEELRTPLILAEYEDLPHAEIARILHCTLKAVDSRLYRAKQQLRRMLEKQLQQG